MTNQTTWPRAILLDFYGTVVKEDDVAVASVCGQIAKASADNVSSEQVVSHWGRLMGKMCLESRGADFRLQREIERMSLEAALRHFGANLDSETLSRGLFEYWERPPIFPESKSVIAQCNVPVCLVTNIDNADLESALRHNALSFELIVTSEDCRAYKPRPEPFEKVLSLLGLSEREVLHVGDSLTADVQGAKALGIPVLWVDRRKRGCPRASQRPDYLSPDLTGILDVLKKYDAPRL